MAEILSRQTVGVKLFILFILIVSSTFVFYFLGGILMQAVFGIGFFDIPGLFENLEDETSVNALKLMQLVNAIGVFVVPPLIFAALVSNRIMKYYQLDKPGPWIIYLLVPAIMVAAMPFINFLSELNKGMEFPEFLSEAGQWIKSREEDAERITRAFLEVDDIPGLLYNLLLIAVIPAIGEELLFRGALQRLFCEGTNSKHWGIWISAIIFSALHMQFYGFLPRMMMGALFGYMLIWSGSLMAPIVAHFINNGVAVVASFLIHKKAISPEIEHLGEGEDQGIYVLVSAALVIIFLLFYYNVSREKNQPDY